MKSPKSFFLLLLAGLFITANCGVVSPVDSETVVEGDLATEKTPTVSIEAAGTDDVTTTVTPSTEPTVPTTPPTNSSTISPPDTTTTSSTPAPLTTTPVPDTNTTTTPAPTTTTTTLAPTTTTPTPAPTTSTLAPTTSTTEVPNNSTTTTTTPAPPAPVPCRRFDGPSFIGGIILTLGLLAICLVAYKFYKARNERNYHTL